MVFPFSDGQYLNRSVITNWFVWRSENKSVLYSSHKLAKQVKYLFDYHVNRRKTWCVRDWHLKQITCRVLSAVTTLSLTACSMWSCRIVMLRFFAEMTKEATGLCTNRFRCLKHIHFATAFHMLGFNIVKYFGVTAQWCNRAREPIRAHHPNTRANTSSQFAPNRMCTWTTVVRHAFRVF